MQIMNDFNYTATFMAGLFQGKLLVLISAEVDFVFFHPPGEAHCSDQGFQVKYDIEEMIIGVVLIIFISYFDIHSHSY